MLARGACLRRCLFGDVWSLEVRDDSIPMTRYLPIRYPISRCADAMEHDMSASVPHMCTRIFDDDTRCFLMLLHVTRWYAIIVPPMCKYPIPSTCTRGPRENPRRTRVAPLVA